MHKGNIRDTDVEPEFALCDDQKPKEQMKMEKMKIVIVTSALFIAAQAYASINISSLDTGAGLYGDAAGTIDPNWTITLLTSTGSPPGYPPSTTAPYGPGPAYLVPNSLGWPLSPAGPWVANDTTSSWVTYSNPTQTGGDDTGGTYQYQLTFTAANSGVVGVSWLSDNNSTLIVNGITVGTRPNPDIPDPNNYTTFDGWNAAIPINIQAGINTIDLDVYNIPQDSGNPTGARVEFTAVPEPATIISGALMLLPFGASTLRILRRNRTV